MAKDKTYKRSRGIVVAVAAVATAALIALMVIEGCKPRTSPEATALMNRADAVMEANPDSALTLLELVDTNTVRGKADRARYALLMSMAIDKNYVDTTSFAILQPAIDYYEKHGTPDERLKTRYYEGRIHMNRGEDDAALTSFLRAAEDSAHCTDRHALARLLIAEGNMYAKQYRLDKYIAVNKEASKIYKALGDTLSETLCMARILSGANLTDDSALADSVLGEYYPYFIKYLHEADYIQNEMMVAYAYNGNKEKLSEVLEISDSVSAPPSIKTSLIKSLSYIKMGDYHTALQKLPDQEALSNIDDSLQYFAIKTELLESTDNYKGALNAYKEYLGVYEHYMNDIFRDSLLFTQNKYQLQLKAQSVLAESERKKSFWIIISLLICLTGLIAYFVMRSKSVKLKGVIDDQKSMMDSLRQEIRSLQSIKIDNTRIESLIRSQIETLNGLLAYEVSGNKEYREKFDFIQSMIKKDKEAFLKRLSNEIKTISPQLYMVMEKGKLTDKEIHCMCLIAIGMRTKDIGGYIGVGGVYNLTKEIRRKLNIDASIYSLASYIKKFF